MEKWNGGEGDKQHASIAESLYITRERKSATANSHERRAEIAREIQDINALVETIIPLCSRATAQPQENQSTDPRQHL